MQFPLRTLFLSLWEAASLQTLLFSAIFLILVQYLQRTIQHRNYPPSPPGLPIVGNFFQIDFSNPQVTFKQLIKKYGNVVCTHAGNKTFMMVTGLPRIKEVLLKEDQVFIDRPKIPVHDYVFKSRGLVMSNGQEWKYQRRFALMTLRNFGLGKRTVEDGIREEARYLTEVIGEEKGKPFDPHFQINNAVSNIICSITFGHRFEYHDSKFRELLKSLDAVTVLEATWQSQVFNMFPRIMKFLPGSHQKCFREWRKLETFVEDEIKQHKENLNSEETQDFIDAYLKELSKHDIHPSFNEKNLVFCTLDLFLAGTETTSTTLRWGLLYMALNPEIQGKIQAEIDRVVGQARQPTMADRENLPYTNAAVHEVQRMGDILPFNVPREARIDTTVAGYHVAKVYKVIHSHPGKEGQNLLNIMKRKNHQGTMMMTNLTTLHKDPKEWATPETFNPEHFLENGQFKKKENFMPFSIGKRACLGEQLARAELFLFFTSLLQKFTFQAPPNTQLTLEFRAGLTQAPVPYKICALPRVM